MIFFQIFHGMNQFGKIIGFSKQTVQVMDYFKFFHSANRFVENLSTVFLSKLFKLTKFERFRLAKNLGCSE